MSLVCAVTKGGYGKESVSHFIDGRYQCHMFLWTRVLGHENNIYKRSVHCQHNTDNFIHPCKGKYIIMYCHLPCSFKSC